MKKKPPEEPHRVRTLERFLCFIGSKNAAYARARMLRTPGKDRQWGNNPYLLFPTFSHNQARCRPKLFRQHSPNLTTSCRPSPSQHLFAGYHSHLQQLPSCPTDQHSAGTMHWYLWGEHRRCILWQHRDISPSLQ